MTLSTTDWNRFFDLLDNGWPGDLDPAAASSYRVLLDGVPADTLTGGLRRLLHSGQRFRPTAAEILAAARRDPSVPTFDELLMLIDRVLTARPAPRGLWREGEYRRATDEAVMERVNGLHPVAASFIARRGLAGLRRLDFGDTWDRKELREAWAAHLEATEGREVAVLAAGSGPGGLRRLDPLGGLIASDTPALNEGDR